jgi:4-alpha-glucanotransferase
MEYPRCSGILLHPTSLPGRYGIGDLGKYAYRFIDYLVEANQSVWQVLPLGPTSYGDSPYQSPSTFAGNSNLISLDKLVEDGYLQADDLNDVPDFPTYCVDYGWIIPYHNEKLRLAFQRFDQNPTATHKQAYDAFCEQSAVWLDDYALFMSVKDSYGGKPWTQWDDNDLVHYQKAAVEKARQAHADDIRYYKFIQWMFHHQWTALRDYAAANQIEFIGDIPIFVAHDSSDVWGNQSLFYLQPDGNPEVIAGVPPDYFSATGQRWGNPLYKWDVMKANDYAWWITRLKSVFTLVDRVRIDHFRGFEAYWEIPATEETAVNGEWVQGAGQHFFDVVKAEMGELPIIAEDLGVITPEVEQLRDDNNFPGMQVLQFAFDGKCGSNTFLPHYYSRNTVVYTGTHDNNTTLGWWHSDEAHDGIKTCVEKYMGEDRADLDSNINWGLIRLAISSVADTCVIPFQDVLGFGADTRMNTPGTQGGKNWCWRFGVEEFHNPVKWGLKDMTTLFSRGRGDKKERVNY